MEGWRQRRLGSKAKPLEKEKDKTDLTLTGLLMEGPIRYRWRITSGLAVIRGLVRGYCIPMTSGVPVIQERPPATAAPGPAATSFPLKIFRERSEHRSV